MQKISDTYYPLGDLIGFVKLVDGMKMDLALKVVNSARISYAKTKKEFDESDTKLSRYLWDNGHTSPYRHTYYTFHIKMPIFAIRQLIKYQVGSTFRQYEIDGDPICIDMVDLMFDSDKGCSWNEVSGRYVKLKPEFYIPIKMRANPKHGNKQSSSELPKDFKHDEYSTKFAVICENAYKEYEQLIEAGIAKEMARMILPQNIYTEAYWTVSLQGVLHFLSQRLKDGAQAEIKKYAESIFEIMRDDLKKLGITRETLVLA